MKRVKRGPKEVGEKVREGEKVKEGEDLGRKGRVKRRNSKAGDTLHPRALARDRYDSLFCNIFKWISQRACIVVVFYVSVQGEAAAAADEEDHQPG